MGSITIGRATPWYVVSQLITAWLFVVGCSSAPVPAHDADRNPIGARSSNQLPVESNDDGQQLDSVLIPEGYSLLVQQGYLGLTDGEAMMPLMVASGDGTVSIAYWPVSTDADSDLGLIAVKSEARSANNFGFRWISMKLQLSYRELQGILASGSFWQDFDDEWAVRVIACLQARESSARQGECARLDGKLPQRLQQDFAEDLQCSYKIENELYEGSCSYQQMNRQLFQYVSLSSRLGSKAKTSAPTQSDNKVSSQFARDLPQWVWDEIAGSNNLRLYLKLWDDKFRDLRNLGQLVGGSAGPEADALRASYDAAALAAAEELQRFQQEQASNYSRRLEFQEMSDELAIQDIDRRQSELAVFIKIAESNQNIAKSLAS